MHPDPVRSLFAAWALDLRVSLSASQYTPSILVMCVLPLCTDWYCRLGFPLLVLTSIHLYAVKDDGTILKGHLPTHVLDNWGSLATMQDWHCRLEHIIPTLDCFLVAMVICMQWKMMDCFIKLLPPPMLRTIGVLVRPSGGWKASDIYIWSADWLLW